MGRRGCCTASENKVPVNCNCNPSELFRSSLTHLDQMTNLSVVAAQFFNFCQWEDRFLTPYLKDAVEPSEVTPKNKGKQGQENVRKRPPHVTIQFLQLSTIIRSVISDFIPRDSRVQVRMIRNGVRQNRRRSHCRNLPNPQWTRCWRIGKIEESTLPFPCELKWQTWDMERSNWEKKFPPWRSYVPTCTKYKTFPINCAVEKKRKRRKQWRTSPSGLSCLLWCFLTIASIRLQETKNSGSSLIFVDM